MLAAAALVQRRRSGRRAPAWPGRGATARSHAAPGPGVPRPSATTTAKPWSANHCEARWALCERTTRGPCGPPYGIEQHRQRRAVVVAGQQHGGGQAALAGERQVDVGAHDGRRGVRHAARRRRASSQCPPRLGERRRADDDRAAAGRDGVHAGLVGERLERRRRGAAPDLDRRRVVDRVGGEHDPADRRRSPPRATCRSGGVTGTPSTSSRRAPSRSAHVTSAPSARERGTPGTSSTHASSWSSASSSRRAGGRVDRRTSTSRWSRRCTVTSSPASLQCTSARYGNAARSHSTSTTRAVEADDVQRDVGVGGAGGRVAAARSVARRGIGGVAEVPALHRRGVDAGRRRAPCRRGSTSSRGSGASPRRR